MDQPLEFKLKVGDVVRLLHGYTPANVPFVVTENVIVAKEYVCSRIANLDGTRPFTSANADVFNECHFELDPFLTAVHRRRHAAKDSL